MKQLLLLVTGILILFNQLSAQLTADAGPDRFACQGAFVTLGGSPTASGGIPPYSYSWAGPQGYISSLANPLAPITTNGTYGVTVTDNLGSQVFDAVTITIQPPPDVSIAPPAGLTCAVTSVTLMASSSVPGVTYDWGSGITSVTRNVTAPGTYSVTVTEPVNGCSASAMVSVSQNILSPNVSIAPPAQLTCTVTSVTLTASSSTSGVVYNWGGGITLATNTVSFPGTYTITVTDPVNGCTASASTVVSYECGFFSVSTQSASCAGTCNGSATVNPAGNYRYLWSNSDTTATSSNLCIGTYSLTVMDSVLTPLDTISVTIGSAASLSFTSSNVTCFGSNNGSITVSATGFTGAVNFSWSNGMNGQTATNLAAGTYSITVTDVAACTVTGSATLNQPTQIFVNASAQPSNCGFSNGMVVTTVSGGTPPYNYIWMDGGIGSVRTSLPAGTYTVTITDNNGCSASVSASVLSTGQMTLTTNHLDASGCGVCDGMASVGISGGTLPYSVLWSNSNTVQAINTLCPGVYTCQVTDAAGCTDTAMVVINAIGSLLNVTTTTLAHVSCTSPTGSLSASVAGGVPPFTYVWSNGDTAAAPTGLNLGTYSVTVTDSTGCVGFAVGGVFNQQSFSYFVYVTVAGYANCGTGTSAMANVYGGTPPFSYLWNTTPPQTTAAATGLSAGSYSVTVIDSAGCQRTGSATVYSMCRNLIHGRIINDLNGNCALDGGEGPLVSKTIVAEDGNQSYYGSTDAQGYYSILVPAGTYTIHPYLSGLCIISCAEINSSYTVSFPTVGDTAVNIDFYMIVAPFNLYTSSSLPAFRPGFTQTVYVYYGNTGTDTISGTLVYTYDADLIYQSSTNNGVHNATNRTITWALTDITPYGYYYSSQYVTISFQTAIGTPLGTSIENRSQITPDEAGECDTTDNVYVVITTIRNSYDPNEKEVMPARDIYDAQDSLLVYTIHFQNTGNDTAWFVVLKDTLSAYLEPGSVRNVAWSHPITEFKVEGEGILTWVFNPIYLVDSFTDVEASKGYVSFQVKKRGSLAIGTEIHNTASIYFDYNEAVVTNTVTTEVADPNYIFTVTGDAGISVAAMPNPFSRSTQLMVEGANGSFDFELFDVTGKILRRMTINENRFELKREDMSAGVYFYRITTSARQRAFGRLVVE